MVLYIFSFILNKFLNGYYNVKCVGCNNFIITNYHLLIIPPDICPFRCWETYTKVNYSDIISVDIFSDDDMETISVYFKGKFVVGNLSDNHMYFLLYNLTNKSVVLTSLYFAINSFNSTRKFSFAV